MRGVCPWRRRWNRKVDGNSENETVLHPVSDCTFPRLDGSDHLQMEVKAVAARRKAGASDGLGSRRAECRASYAVCNCQFPVSRVNAAAACRAPPKFPSVPQLQTEVLSNKRDLQGTS